MEHIGDTLNRMAEPSEREAQDAFVQALLKGRYGIVYDPTERPDLPEDAWGMLSREAKWFRGKFESAKVPAPKNATPELIVEFFQWFRKNHPETRRLPQSHEAIMRQWTNFEVSRTKRRNRAEKTDPSSGLGLDRFEKPDYVPLPPDAVAQLLEDSRSHRNDDRQNEHAMGQLSVGDFVYLADPQAEARVFGQIVAVIDSSIVRVRLRVGGGEVRCQADDLVHCIPAYDAHHIRAGAR